MHPGPTLTILAAQAAAADSLKKVPTALWLNVAICLVTLVIVVRVWRTLRGINEFLPWIAALLAGGMIFSYWTYNRTEPKFLTPIVDQLTQILPTKSKHEQDLDRLRKSRDNRP